MPTIDYRDCDRQIWEEELADFVPDRLLDAHVHFYWRSDLDEIPPHADAFDHGLETLNQWANVLYPGRRMQYLTLGNPVPGRTSSGTSTRCGTRSTAYPASGTTAS